MAKANNDIKEFHLFAGIGGGIYGGELLGHKCCAGVEIDEFCKKILLQRQADVFYYYASGSDYGILSNSNARNNHRTSSDPDIFSDMY